MTFPSAFVNADNTLVTDGRRRPSHYHKPRRAHQFKPGEPVYSKRCSPVAAFEGVIVSPRGAGFQVLDPKTGKTYQRDTWDLIPIAASGTEAKEESGE